jgi:alkanesulfonate monooxygenase SsuD/methylene tetrahydromethanopterin reductase-like flavin-dependent oxidoreductase (luciferase family)
MSITFGIHLGQQDISADELRRLWRYADTRGFGWMSVWDHFYRRDDDRAPHFEAIALLGAMAVETTRIRFGCMVFAVQFRNVGLLAKSVLTIDHLSGGRFEPGLGAGWHEPEYRAFGYDFAPVKRRLDQLEEGMAVLRMLLEQDVTSHHGRYFQLTDARMNPKPVAGRVPLWIGGGGERRTARIAARHADGWNIPYVGPEEYRHKMAVLDEWCAVEGRDPAALRRATQLGFYMAAADDRRAIDAALAVMTDQLGEQPPARLAGNLTGGPADVIERVAAYREAGVTDLNIAIRPPVDWSALDAFVERVMPEFV